MPYGGPVCFTAVGVGLATLLALHTLKIALIRHLGRLSQRTRTHLDDLLVDLLRHTRGVFLLGAAGYAATLFLPLSGNQLEIRKVAMLLLILWQVATWGAHTIQFLVARWVEKKLPEDAAGATTVASLGNLPNVQIDTLLAGLGIGGAAVALALQNILGDLFAFLSIIFDKPFVIGDFVVAGEYMGTVERTGLKTTRIRSLSGELVVMGNSDLVGSRIRNYKQMRERRVVFTLGVLYETLYGKLVRYPA